MSWRAFANPSAEIDERQLDRLVPGAAGDIPPHRRLELIRYDDELGAYVTAHDCLASVLGLNAPLVADEPVEFAAGDAIVCAGSRLSPERTASSAVAKHCGRTPGLSRCY